MATKILITGAAGFIGFHLVRRLLGEPNDIVGIDNINDYYDVNLKYARLAETGIYAEEESDHLGGCNREYHHLEVNRTYFSECHSNYRFIRMNLEDKSELMKLFEQEHFDIVVNLAAQAGVRYSLENPDVYIQSNVVGFLNILEACRHYPVKQLMYASSSSVYGANVKVPFSETDSVDHPVSLYAATKKSNELMAHTYSHLYDIPVTGLRFFTVYGSWGRPDMSPILFADAITKGKAIKVFNKGEMERDFTFIGDIVEGMYKLLNKEDFSDRYRLFNIGKGKPVNLLEFIDIMGKTFGKEVKKTMLPMQPGDVKRTWADTQALQDAVDYSPKVDLEEGIQHFATWYTEFYNREIGV